MKNIMLAGKILAIAVFGILGLLSVIMFPILIGSSDPETATIGYGYLGTLLIAFLVFYAILKKEMKYERS